MLFNKVALTKPVKNVHQAKEKTTTFQRLARLKRERQTSNMTANVGSRDIFCRPPLAVCANNAKLKVTIIRERHARAKR